MFAKRIMMKVIFLGTSCMQPTKDRNHTGILVIHNEEHILLDCGEGVQRQIKFTDIKLTKITRLLISHWHGDHILGVPGLMQTLGANEYSRKLRIYGPMGSKKYMISMLKSFFSRESIHYDLKETKEGRVFESKNLIVEALLLDHGINTLGYSIIEKDRLRVNMAKLKKIGVAEGPHIAKIQEGEDIIYKGKKIEAKDYTTLVKGKKITYIADTKLCDNCFKLAQDADLLICESTYASDLAEKAEKYLHLTAKDAAFIANRANSKKLVLTHFSQRYKDTSKILEDASTYFKDVVCAYDFMKIKV